MAITCWLSRGRSPEAERESDPRPGIAGHVQGKMVEIGKNTGSHKRHRGDSNPCGQSPMDFESISLATRTQCLGTETNRRRVGTATVGMALEPEGKGQEHPWRLGA